MAGRLSYFLNLRGPVMSIDTACSSGLVAFHQAVRSLESGECDIAIVAAANIMCTAKELSELTDAGMVSLSGVCAAFGAEADGLVPGEAVVAVVLAREDVVSAHGLGRVARVLGSGVNCDGRTNGISAPSGQAQVELLVGGCWFVCVGVCQAECGAFVGGVGFGGFGGVGACVDGGGDSAECVC